MTPAEKQLELTATLENLNDDERNVVLGVALKVARRVHMGRQQYGALDLATDKRNWMDEIEAEMLDGNIYVEFAKLTAERRRA